MNEREERLSKHVETLMKMKDVMLNDENWERLKPEIDAVIAGGMALQASIDNGKFVSMSVIEDIKSEISKYKDDKAIHVERNEMIDIVLEIIDKHISGKEQNG